MCVLVRTLRARRLRTYAISLLYKKMYPATEQGISYGFIK